MAKKYIKPADFSRVLQELSDEENERQETFVLESDSDLSEEGIEINNISSDSEQSISDDDENDYLEEKHDDDKFYVGKDKFSKWRKEKHAKCSKTKKNNIVKIKPGLKDHAKDIEDEIGSFLKIIDINMVDKIVDCTNAHIILQKCKYSRDRDCTITSRAEMMAYFRLLYMIGIKKGHHVNVKELFSSDGTGIEITRAVMGYKRFLFLTSCLRFDDKLTRPDRRKTDKLAAIRTIFESFLKNFNDCYTLGEFVTIDEMLHPFRGRCQWIQYIPSKPSKYGIKMYALCDAKTYYTSGLEIYCGAQPNGCYAVSNSPIDVVKRLVSPLENSCRNITTDNYYTSIPLADYLLQKKLTLVGTLKKNKKEVPLEFLPNKTRMVRTAVFGFQSDKVLVSYVPRKNKAVILLSTMHDEAHIDASSNKPEIIMDYNATKGGVDTVDKLCATYSVKRITRRWPCAIFFSLLNIAGINAQVLYMLTNPDDKAPCRRIFLKNLSLSLMKDHLQSRSKLRTLPSDISSFLSRNYAVPNYEVPEQTSSKRGTCGLCIREKKRSSASMKCKKCLRYTCKRHSITEIICFECSDDLDH